MESTEKQNIIPTTTIITALTAKPIAAKNLNINCVFISLLIFISQLGFYKWLFILVSIYFCLVHA